MPSIHDVAKLAKVSIATVSRVITNNAPVDEATRKRVETAIEESGYRPNIVAQSLRSKSGKLIGLLVPGLGNPAFTGFIEALAHAAETRGLGLIIADSRNDPDTEIHAIDSMLRRNVDGIILSRVSDKSRVLDHFVKKNEKPVPLVVVDRALPHEDIPNVVVDNYEAGFIAGDHLASVGCKRIACASGPRDITLVRDRNRGFSDAFAARRIPFDETMVYECDFSFESGRDTIISHCSDPAEFDGIWCHDDVIALGVMSALHQCGRQVPEDVAVMGMDDIPFSRMCHPTLTTIVQPYNVMSDTVLSLVETMKTGEKLAENHIVLDVAIEIRGSTDRLGCIRPVSKNMHQMKRQL